MRVRVVGDGAAGFKPYLVAIGDGPERGMVAEGASEGFVEGAVAGGVGAVEGFGSACDAGEEHPFAEGLLLAWDISRRCRDKSNADKMIRQLNYRRREEKEREFQRELEV